MRFVLESLKDTDALIFVEEVGEKLRKREAISPFQCNWRQHLNHAAVDLDEAAKNALDQILNVIANCFLLGYFARVEFESGRSAQEPE